VNLVAVVGDDFPERFLNDFRSRNVDLRGLQSVPGATFRWGGRYRLDMNTRDTLYTKLGVFADFHPELPQGYCDADIIFLANILPTLQLDVLSQAERGKPGRLRALDTMNLWIETARDDLLQVMRGVDMVLIAEDEVRQLAETPSLRAGARYILGLGPRVLVVKQGSYGAVLFGSDGSFFAAPAYPLEDVRDPTGAGDAFAGGFLGYLARCLKTAGHVDWPDYKRALIYGNIMGSFACEEFSVERLRQLTPEHVAQRYHEFVRFTHFEGDWGE
jgi:sugar/nucleoside kinase (ribokinase family)